MNKRTSRFVGLALVESARSTYQRVQIGAVIARGSSLISAGANLAASHPLQKRYNDCAGRCAPAHNLHAELHAIVRAKGESLNGCHIYVARLDRRGMWADCRPCPACSLAIRLAGIALVTYSTPKGVFTIPAEELNHD